MQTLHSIPELRTIAGPLFLAIGVFDGVHRGHQAVISTAVRDAQAGGGTAVVVTFDPHPAKILRPERAPRLLTATAHKSQLLRDLGVSHLLLVKFDRAFAVTEPADFVRQLAEHAQPLREICVGHEWSFGRNRAGNLDLLKQLGGELGFHVVGIPPVEVGGRVVSSTAIRQCVEAGDFAGAAEMLGRDYTVLGTVTRGDQLGRQLGYPTANLRAHNEQFPPNGVYAAEARVNGATHLAAANLGHRPTLNQAEPQRVLEVHLLDFDADIYGADVELRFLKRLRPEVKFANLEELQAQIARDVAQTRALARG